MIKNASECISTQFHTVSGTFGTFDKKGVFEPEKNTFFQSFCDFSEISFFFKISGCGIINNAFLHSFTQFQADWEHLTKKVFFSHRKTHFYEVFGISLKQNFFNLSGPGMIKNATECISKQFHTVSDSFRHIGNISQ